MPTAGRGRLRAWSVAIAAPTSSGRAAQLLAARRPHIAVIACTPDEGMSRQLALTWGVESIRVDGAENIDQMVEAIDATIRAHGLARPGDHIVVVAGAPIGADQAVNTVMVHQVGSVPFGARA